MRVAVLTTDTLHHAHFVRELAKTTPLARVFVETTGLKPPFDTSHPFEQAREEFERALWFGGAAASVSAFGEVESHASMNDAAALASLAALRADVVVVFGTGKLAKSLIEICPRGIVNLHGGDPEAYRGLDTHLWAIYHQDFGGLTTTLHRLSAELDCGDIIANLPLAIGRGMSLHELRAANTDVCIQLVRGALDVYRARGSFVARPQREHGRYYSFMPSVLKELCVKRFAKYTRDLP